MPFSDNTVPRWYEGLVDSRVNGSCPQAALWYSSTHVSVTARKEAPDAMKMHMKETRQSFWMKKRGKCVSDRRKCSCMFGDCLAAPVADM